MLVLATCRLPVSSRGRLTYIFLDCARIEFMNKSNWKIGATFWAVPQVRKPATATIMITEAFFLVAGFELEGYDEFIGSRCVVRAEQIVAQNHNCSRGEGFVRQIILGLA